MKRIVSGFLAVAMLACGALTATAGAATNTSDPVAVAQELVFEPFASEHISSWSPLLSRTAYGASVTFNGPKTGSVFVELQNSSGTTIASFTENFTSRNSIAYTRNRTTASGTYRIKITVTISGVATSRTSSYVII